jgi:hypothetical protein
MKTTNKWTRFWDMNSGGRQKEKWDMIYIEASREIAERVFYARFGHNPNRVTCTCCGSDYSIDEEASLEEATGYQRGCKWSDKKSCYVEEQNDKSYARKYQTLESYLKDNKGVLIIYASDIKENETIYDPPEEGYVWK